MSKLNNFYPLFLFSGISLTAGTFRTLVMRVKRDEMELMFYPLCNYTEINWLPDYFSYAFVFTLLRV